LVALIALIPLLPWLIPWMPRARALIDLPTHPLDCVAWVPYFSFDALMHCVLALRGCILFGDALQLLIDCIDWVPYLNTRKVYLI